MQTKIVYVSEYHSQKWIFLKNKKKITQFKS